jgi:sugar phosphate isomerase/epimerase
MCEGGNCPIKETCYRNISSPVGRQDWFGAPPFMNDNCDQYMKSIRIGNQTAFSAKTITEPFEFAKNSEFNAFEWFPDKRIDGLGWKEQDITSALRSQIQEEAKSRNIELSVKANLAATPLTPEGQDLIQDTLDLAVDLGAKSVIFQLDVSQGSHSFLIGISKFFSRFANEKIRLCLENSMWTGPAHFNEFFNLIARKFPAYKTNICMCFNLGAANLYVGKRNDYIGYMEAISPDIAIEHLHLHENFGEQDEHLVFFTGPSAHSKLGIERCCQILQKRGFKGTVIMEQWPNPPLLLINTQREFLKIWQWINT